MIVWVLDVIIGLFVRFCSCYNGQGLTFLPAVSSCNIRMEFMYIIQLEKLRAIFQQKTGTSAKEQFLEYFSGIITVNESTACHLGSSNSISIP